MSDTDRQFVSRRTLVISAAIVAVIIAGVVLFFLYGGELEPLLGSAWITTTA
jgi:hypothetical protein